MRGRACRVSHKEFVMLWKSIISSFLHLSANSTWQNEHNKHEHSARLEVAAKPALYLHLPPFPEPSLSLGIINGGTFNWVVPLLSLPLQSLARSASLPAVVLVYVGEMGAIASERARERGRDRCAARFPRAIITHSEDGGRRTKVDGPHGRTEWDARKVSSSIVIVGLTLHR